ncbi:MAG: hypothetical protein ABR555_17585 [Pyrinomonadaceae bacterium]
MQKLVIVLLATLFAQSGTQYAIACGDKTMRVKTGLRYYQTQAAKHPSTVLIHSAALPSGKAIELRDFLNKVGHKATALDDVDSIKRNLRNTHYDLVLTNLAEAPDLQKQVESFAPNTRIVPVLFRQPKSEEQAAAKQYKVVLNNPKDGLDFLIAVSRVMGSQSKKS